MIVCPRCHESDEREIYRYYGGERFGAGLARLVGMTHMECSCGADFYVYRGFVGRGAQWGLRLIGPRLRAAGAALALAGHCVVDFVLERRRVVVRIRLRFHQTRPAVAG